VWGFQHEGVDTIMENKAAAELVGRQLRRAREDLGLMQVEVAERLGLIKETYSSWERAVRLMPTNYLPEVSRILHRPIGYFLGEPDERGLDNEEQLLVTLFRSIQSPEVRNLVISTTHLQVETIEAIARISDGPHTEHTNEAG